MIVQFEVGKKFPLPYRQQDGMSPMLDDVTLAFIVSLSGVTKIEKQSFCKDPVKYGVWVEQSIPFILWNYSKFQLDCYIDILVEPKEKRDVFLDGWGNLLQSYLVDPRTGILAGMRSIGAVDSFMSKIKNACTEQVYKYSSSAEIAAKAQDIQHNYSLAKMLQLAEMYDSGQN
jgi:hypothetical protein